MDVMLLNPRNNSTEYVYLPFATLADVDNLIAYYRARGLEAVGFTVREVSI